MHILAFLAALPLALGAEPSTKNTVKNLDPDTGNRLAFKRAASPDTGLASRKTDHWDWSSSEQSKNCTHLDKLRMYFELGSARDSGTRGTVTMSMSGMTNQVHPIGKDIRPGFSDWQDIIFFNPVRLRDAKLRIIIEVEKSRGIRNSKGSIHVNSIKFRGRCANSQTWIENNRFASLDKTMEMKKSFELFKPRFSVWDDSLALADWMPRPTCSRLKQLNVGLQLADEAWAGTDQSLDLAIGNYRDVLATDPSRGEYFEKQINIVSAFGSSTIALADIKDIRIENKEGDSDKFLHKEITMRATCDDPSGTKMEFKKKMGEWVGAKVVIPVDSDGWEIRS